MGGLPLAAHRSSFLFDGPLARTAWHRFTKALQGGDDQEAEMKKGKWSKDEDNRLREGVALFGIPNWAGDASPMFPPDATSICVTSG
jgi:hypothetical protein